MKEEKDILARAGRNDGMTVPEGFFADFATRMAGALDQTPFEESASKPLAAPRSFWHRVRPYVYMAAMFAGVWCMLKMFTTFSSPADHGMQPTPVLAEALGNEIFVGDYLIDEIDQWDLMDEMMESGVDVRSLASSFQDSETEQFQ